MAVYIAIRSYFQRAALTQKTSVNVSSVGDMLLVFLVVVGQIVLPAEYIFSRWLNPLNYVLPLSANVPGALCLVGGLWLFWRSHVDLENSWSVTLKIREEHRLVTNGVYRFIRHPMYASFFLLAFAQALLLGNWLSGWSGLTAVALLYSVRVWGEEAMMLRSFGTEYERYVARTGGVVPRLREPMASNPSIERTSLSWLRQPKSRRSCRTLGASCYRCSGCSWSSAAPVQRAARPPPSTLKAARARAAAAELSDRGARSALGKRTAASGLSGRRGSESQLGSCQALPVNPASPNLSVERTY